MARDTNQIRAAVWKCHNILVDTNLCPELGFSASDGRSTFQLIGLEDKIDEISQSGGRFNSMLKLQLIDQFVNELNNDLKNQTMALEFSMIQNYRPSNII